MFIIIVHLFRCVIELLFFNLAIHSDTEIEIIFLLANIFYYKTNFTIITNSNDNKILKSSINRMAHVKCSTFFQKKRDSGK